MISAEDKAITPKSTFWLFENKITESLLSSLDLGLHLIKNVDMDCLSRR